MNRLYGLIANPATGNISHSKLWANVAACAMTVKFVLNADAPEWMWWAYGGMVGGYAVLKRAIAAVPQTAAAKQEQNHVD